MNYTKQIALTLLTGAMIVGCGGTTFNKTHWGYEGEHDPAHWNKVSATCGEGKAQSPINIVTADATTMPSSKMVVFHESTHAEPSHEVDNGHAIKIAPVGNDGIELGDVHYKLLQFHFHGNSEHLINGKHFDMEMHLVHQNDKGELAVVGVMIKKGAHNTKLEGVLSHLDGGDLQVTVNDLLPSTEHYYHYMGSLTTPPCSENVRWYVLDEPIEIDAAQLAKFRAKYSNNFRPAQAMNGRSVEHK